MIIIANRKKYLYQMHIILLQVPGKAVISSFGIREEFFQLL